MISAETQQRLNALEGQQDSYLPNAYRSEQLTALEALLLVAPSAGGKSFAMEAVARLSPRHAIAGTRTSREPRPDDAGRSYHYFQRSDEGLAPFLHDVEAGEVVQYAVHPFTKDVYCTYITDYPGEINMLDTLASGVATLRRLPFKRVSVVSLVTEPTTWQARFNERFPVGHPKRGARRDEAVDSLAWSLDQPDTGVHWIENITDQPDITARHIIGLSNGRYMYEPRLRRLAEQCLNAATDMEI